jgi:probable HAF family extracellular repeat protein
MRRSVGLGLFLVAASALAADPTYKLRDLGRMVDPIDLSVEGFNPLAVNDSGLIVGYHRKAYNPLHAALLLRDGSLQDLGTLGGSAFETSQAYAINARGDIAGWSGQLYATSEAFVIRGGVMQHLGVLPGASVSAAYGINNRGDVVGTGDCVCQTAAESHALLFANGVVADLGVLPGGRYAAALAINNRGQIVGSSDFLEETGGHAFINGVHAFLYENGQMTDLATLPGGSRFKSAVDINDRGQVIGYSDTSSDPPDNRSFLYQRGHLRDLMGDRESAAIALAINNSGEIVGWASVPRGNDAQAVIFAPDGPIELNGLVREPEWRLLAAIDVNDAGGILGYGFFRGQLHGFFLERVSRSVGR